MAHRANIAVARWRRAIPMSDTLGHPHATNNAPLPKIGDRVGLAGRDEAFIVIAVDEENRSVSLAREDRFVRLPIEKILSLMPVR
jgi:hypothetical protein